jgi:hypothetical protein
MFVTLVVYKYSLLFQMYSAISEWASGTRRPADFKLSIVENVYYGHCATLEEFRKRQPNKYHRAMSQLYNEVYVFFPW